MFNFGEFLKKNAIAFDLTETKRKKISRRNKILLCIHCCYQKCQNRKKKNKLFLKIFSTKSLFFQKVQIKKKKDIFSDSGGSSGHFDYLFTCLGLKVKL